MANPQTLDRKGAPRLAFCLSAPAVPAGPAVMFLGGFRSDMTGTKATYIEESCHARSQPFIRFDYSGHGASEGRFEDGTIGAWTDDAAAILDHLRAQVPGRPVILVGSSMGGWIALLLARRYSAGAICGVIGIAAAPDFTRRFYSEELDDAQRALLNRQGHIDLPNAYSAEPYRFTKALIEDGERHCILDRAHTYPMPIRLLQGMQDEDVPWQTAYRIKNTFPDSDIQVIPVEHGDHRLSRPEDLALIDTQIRLLSGGS